MNASLTRYPAPNSPTRTVSDVEFAHRYNNNVTSILDYGALPGGYGQYNSFSAAWAARYGAGRVIYFRIPPIDFLPPSIIVGDFDDSVQTDLAMFSLSGSSWWVLESNGSVFTPIHWETLRTASGVLNRMSGDYSGDGRHDIAQFHPSNGTWWVRDLLETDSSRRTGLPSPPTDHPSTVSRATRGWGYAD